MFDRILSSARMKCDSLCRKHVEFNRSAFVHWSVQVSECGVGSIRLGPRVRIGRNSWLNTPASESPSITRGGPKLVVAEGVAIGRNNVISALNGIHIDEHVVTAPNVLLMDHAHEFRDPNVPILLQGVTQGGVIHIERGCWIGFGAVVVCNRGTLTIGENAVVGANAVVTSSVPARSVVAGSPARVLRRYNLETDQWERVHG